MILLSTSWGNGIDLEVKLYVFKRCNIVKMLILINFYCKNSVLFWKKVLLDIMLYLLLPFNFLGNFADVMLIIGKHYENTPMQYTGVLKL